MATHSPIRSLQLAELSIIQRTIHAHRVEQIERDAYGLQQNAAPATLHGKALHLALLQHNRISFTEYSILQGLQ